jgi:protein gp37
MRLAATRFKGHESREGLARMHKGKPQWTGKVLLNRRVALDPYRWQRPRRIFVCAHGDLFHEAVPDAWIDFVFFIALLCPQHTFQILTKRPERMREYMQIVLEEPQEATAFRFAVAAKHAGLENLPREKRPELHWPPRNCWLGTSTEDQQRWDERVHHLTRTPAAVRWVSAEPLLGPIEMGGRIDWLVVGGESGLGARPMHPGWVRSLRGQCAQFGVAFFCKQLSIPGSSKALKDIDQFPADLRVREWPQ